MKRLSQKHRIVAWMKSHRGERLSPRRALFMNMGTKSQPVSARRFVTESG